MAAAAPPPGGPLSITRLSMRSGDEQLSLASAPLPYRQTSFSHMESRTGNARACPPPPPPPPALQPATSFLQSSRRPPADSYGQQRSAVSASPSPAGPSMDRETLQYAAASLRKTGNNGSLRGDQSDLSNGRMAGANQHLSGRDWTYGAVAQPVERDQARAQIHVTSTGPVYSGPVGDFHRHSNQMSSYTAVPSRIDTAYSQPMHQYSSSSYSYSSASNSDSIRNPREHIHAYATRTPAASYQEALSVIGGPPKPSRQDPSATAFARQLRDQGLTASQRAANQAQVSTFTQRPLPASIAQLYESQNRSGGADQVDLLIRKMEQNMRTGEERANSGQERRGAASGWIREGGTSSGGRQPPASMAAPDNCVKCGEGISSNRPGCTALDQTFHVDCFQCSVCNNPLAGASFYNVNGSPMCDRDYQNTLERCSKCGQAIAEKLLRASGKAFHPNCFSCVVCSKSLDGVPFTVDTENNVHCVPCYHQKFAPRCAVCNQPITPQEGEQDSVRVIAMERSYHVNCYRCEDCGVQLSTKLEGQGCYPLDDHLLCKTCNVQRIRALTSR